MEPDSSAKEEDIDVYAYAKNTELFTSEIFKIEVNNFPKYMGYKQLKNRLTFLELKPVKIKVFDKSSYAFVTFRNEEDKKTAMEKLHGHVWKGCTLSAKNASPVADPLLKKRKAESQTCSSVKRLKDCDVTELLNDAVTPLWRVDYAEQLQKKLAEIEDFIKTLDQKVGQNISKKEEKQWLEENRTLYGSCCKVSAVKPSPEIENYRNKSEFTIGSDSTDTDKSVGFRIGSYKDGDLCVVSPQKCVHIPDRAKEAAKVVEAYLQKVSPLSYWNPETKVGCWHTVTVRTSRKDHLLLLLGMYSFKLTEQDILDERKRLVEFLTEGEGQTLAATSVFLEVKDMESKKSTLEHVYGDKFLMETLLELTYRISPTVFFQVNTAAAEVLYSLIAELAGVSDDVILLDVCCGAGTIGLSMAKNVKKVIGIEMCKEAIVDAKHNAEINGIKNVDFYAAKAEHILPRLVKQYKNDKVIAVVDPPRGGLHVDVVLALRASEFVEKLVYVSCNPKGTYSNLVDLTKTESRRVKGNAFKVDEAVPVDMFPQTNHCELVLSLTRATPRQ